MENQQKRMYDFLQDLNDEQRNAVEYCDGPQLVIAGAGSGKTRVLTYKIAYLLNNKGMEPGNILALTFTNKAANEMKERVGQLVDADMARRIYMGSFHSIFYRILRAEYRTIGFKSNFTIFDESDSCSLINSIIKELSLDGSIYKAPVVHNIISVAKNNLVTPEQYMVTPEYYERDKRNRRPSIGNIYMEYANRCRRANVMDFDDLLMMTFNMFNEHDDILRKYVSLFRYVLVDECQDTNYAQQRIITQLTNEHKHVCMVGDDAQSVYAFRGANIEYMLNFQANKEFRIFKLEQNYRSTQYIVEAANSLIRHNKKQIDKEVFSKNGKGERLVLKCTFSDREEASIVCKEIKRLKAKESCGYNNFCILYRTNALSRNFEEDMRKQAIPYRIFGGLSFYQRKEIKDIIAYLRMVVNPYDEEAIKRIINYPSRGIGAMTLKKLVAAANKNGVSMWEVVSAPERYNVDVKSTKLSKLRLFYDLIATFIDRKDTENAYTLGKDIIEKSGIKDDIYSDNTPENLSRQQNVEEFVSALRDFVDEKIEQGNEHIYLNDFLQETTLMTDIDRNDTASDRVSLMTVHAAKGLEFSTVFIVGLEENIFPSQRSLNSLGELEEERRLLYVAITRAKRHCYLTWAKSRYRYGKMEFGTPSRFIKEIDSALIHTGTGIPCSQTSYSRKQRELDGPSTLPTCKPIRTAVPLTVKPSTKLGNVETDAEKTYTDISEGSIMEHQRFGIGTVEKMEGKGENTKATVRFQNVGVKQLLLKFARYKIVKK